MSCLADDVNLSEMEESSRSDSGEDPPEDKRKPAEKPSARLAPSKKSRDLSRDSDPSSSSSSSSLSSGSLSSSSEDELEAALQAHQAKVSALNSRCNLLDSQALSLQETLKRKHDKLSSAQDEVQKLSKRLRT